MKSTIKDSRRRRKLQSKKKFIIPLVILFIVIPTIVLGFYALQKYTTPLYISPLAIVRVVSGVGDEEVFVKKVTDGLRKERIPFTKVDTNDGETYTVYLADKGEVLMSTKKDVTEQIASLQVIYNRLTMEGKRFRKLDLRFGKPVIVLDGKDASSVKKVEVTPDITTVPDASPSAESNQ